MGSFSCVFMCLFKFFSWNLLRQTGQILSNSDTLRDCWGLPTCTGACPWSPSPPRGCPWSPPPPRCCPWSPSLSRICPWSPSPPIGWLEAEVCGAGETLPRGGLLGLGVGGALFPLSKREEVDMLARCGCGEAAGESAVWSDSVEEECIRLALLTTGDFSMPICSSLSPRLSATKKNSSKVCWPTSSRLCRFWIIWPKDGVSSDSSPVMGGELTKPPSICFYYINLTFYQNRPKSDISGALGPKKNNAMASGDGTKCKT